MPAESVDVDVDRAIRWCVASAVVVFVCGVLAIVLPLRISVEVPLLLGWLFVFAAFAHLVFALYFGAPHWGWHTSIAGFYGLAGITLLVNPLLGVVLFALVVGVVLIAEGMIEMVLFFMLRHHHQALWILIDGIVTVVLGIVACAHWPPATPEIVQYLVGISFISSGISRVVLAFALDVIAPTETRLK